MIHRRHAALAVVVAWGLASAARAADLAIVDARVGYTDAFDTPEEYQLMAGSGLDWRAILTTLTTAPAKRFGYVNRKGVVKPGMDADLVVLDVDPATDVTAFAKVHDTISGGRLIYAAGVTPTVARDHRYGLIGSLTAKPGHRDELIALLPTDAAKLPGCLSYVVAKDIANPDVIWVTEIWRDKASHEASLGLPIVRDAILAARPLIGGGGKQIETEPVDASPQR